MKGMILLLAGLGLAAPAFGVPSVPVKCAANEERVWVYNNLTTWDVGARLKCGTLVEVLGIEKGYVRVRTGDGNEGYVPANAVPQAELSQIIVVAAPAPSMTVVAAARANTEGANPHPVSAPQPAPVMSDRPRMARASTVSAEDVAEEAPAPPQPAAPGQGVPRPPSGVVPPVAPAPVPDTMPAEQNRPTPPDLPSPRQDPLPANGPSAPTPIASGNAAPQGPAIRTSSLAVPTVSTISTGRAKVAAAPVAAPQPTTTVLETHTEASSAEPAWATAPATTVNPVKYMTITGKRSRAGVRTPEFSDDDDDFAEPGTAAVEDLSACRVYFSAYGVTPMQYKWIADQRSKRFPGVCPAPEPSLVDYVVIFTHDMNYFTTTLPEAIHTDQNGFSDWSPVTSVDDTQIPASLLDKAHREYAWVFRVHRGTFDPGKFTARRRPQYTKAASRSYKSIEDAMEFMADSSPR